MEDQAHAQKKALKDKFEQHQQQRETKADAHRKTHELTTISREKVLENKMKKLDL